MATAAQRPLLKRIRTFSNFATFLLFRELWTPLKLTKRKKNLSSIVHIFHKREIRHFHVVIMQWAKKCTKKSDARAKISFCLINKLLFWRSRCCRRHCCLSSLVLCWLVLGGGLWPGCHELLRRLLPYSLATYKAPTLHISIGLSLLVFTSTLA